ncbi:MAG: hypothetical protein MHM6MM_002819 [Cercozoa sp. M6MM]
MTPKLEILSNVLEPLPRAEDGHPEFIDLNYVDNFLPPFFANMCFVLEAQSDLDVEQLGDRLRSALKKTVVQSFPSFRRVLHLDEARQVWQLRADESPRFRFAVARASHVTVSQVKQGGFPSVPVGVMPVSDISVSLMAQLTQLADGYVITLAASHALADGFSVALLARTWSANLRDGKNEHVPCTLDFRFDYGDKGKSTSYGPVGDGAFSFLEPGQVRPFVFPAKPPVTRAIRLSKAQVAHLKQHVFDFCDAHPDMRPERLSGNDVVTALAWLCSALARSEGRQGDLPVACAVAADWRPAHRLGSDIPSNYFGNGSAMANANTTVSMEALDQDEKLKEAFALCALAVRRSVTNYTKDEIHTVLARLAQAKHDRPLETVSTPYDRLTVDTGVAGATNWVRFDLYNAESYHFGFESPSIVFAGFPPLVETQGSFPLSLISVMDTPVERGSFDITLGVAAGTSETFDRLVAALLA